MTRFEFLGKIDAYKKNQISVREMGDAVETYSAALLQQTPCSTLRDFVAQMLNKEQQLALQAAHDNDGEKTREHSLNKEKLQRVLSFIEKLWPVA